MPHRLYQKTFETPLGEMVCCASEEGVCLLEFSDKNNLEKELQAVSNFYNSGIKEGENLHIENTGIQLNEYFAGKRQKFSVPLVFIGTDFQKSVWESLCTIPFGSTKSYVEQSKILGNDKAIRAVASANARNKIAIMVPCHRVLGSNGKLTGYAGGIWRKEKLLGLELSNFE